uniref:Uncharacterized protein n=1 Tax=Anguilla anguilla TaxID=7936 RepID=A0A0E9QMS0_ANGAN
MYNYRAGTGCHFSKLFLLKTPTRSKKVPMARHRSGEGMYVIG